jgi:RND family efflux transporter MFP subunit
MAGVLVLVLLAPAAALAQTPPPAEFTLPPIDDMQAAGQNNTDDAGRIRTQLVARHDAVLSSELAAPIAELPLHPGDGFSAGDVLVRFDCALFEAQLRKAEATASGASETYAVTKRLAALHSAGELEVAQADARAREAEAEAAYLQATVDKCTIVAPFDGRVARRLKQPYEYVTPGNPLLEIVDTGALELQLLVPSGWVSWLKPDTTFTVHVEELDADFPAHVTRIGSIVDPVSQSISISGQLDRSDALLLPGMSGWALFQVSPSAQ